MTAPLVSPVPELVPCLPCNGTGRCPECDGSGRVCEACQEPAQRCKCEESKHPDDYV